MAEILRLRDPGAAASPAAGARALGLDRALIIEDFLRLKSAQIIDLTESVRRIDDRLLRSLRDSGRLTPEVCAIVRFMHEYYVDNGHGRGGAPVDRETRLPAVSAAPPADTAPAEPPALTAPRPRPVRPARSSQLDVTPELADKPRRVPSATAAAQPADSLSETELAQAARDARRVQPQPPAETPSPALPTPQPAEPPIQVAALEPVQPPEPSLDLRRTALHLISDLEAQLKVAPYLTFRDARLSIPPVPSDELEKRRDASLRAVARLVALLTTMNADPALRDVVQASLGPTGRARVRQAMDRSLKNMPDAQQRERAERLWSQLMASTGK